MRIYIKKCCVILSIVLTMANTTVESYGAWEQQGEHWVYEDNHQSAVNTWRLIDKVWYYFDENGFMVTSWKQIGGRWYFFNPISDGTKGMMLTGWQWIDGYCYYLAGGQDTNSPEGAMYENMQTPDRFSVNSSGAWINEDGITQYQAGKGIQTQVTKKAVSTRHFSGGGSGGGGGSGHSRSGTKKSPKPQAGKTEESKPEKEPSTPSSAQPEDKETEFHYTIRYLDVESKAVLKLVTGKSQEDADILIDTPEFDGYEICSGQKEQFRLVTDGMKINIYYSKLEPASPSEAKKVSWKLYFVEEDNHSNEIFKSQSGQSEEDTQLTIDFPETVLGTDRYYYHSLETSPWSMVVSGTGTQKYYIEYEKGEKLPEEEDPDFEARNELNQWLDIARESDLAITGEEPTDQQLITNSLEESNERLLNLTSMADGTDRKEVYLIAKNHIPTTVVLSQKIKNIKNLSQLVRAEFVLDGDSYTVMRVGFEKTYEESTCSHDYEIIERVEPTCTENGYEVIRCRTCGKEETVILPSNRTYGLRSRRDL